MGSCLEVCRSIPWVTLIAVIMNIIGVMFFTEGVMENQNAIEEYLNLYYTTRVVAIAWVVLLGLDVWYMLIAILSCGATRDKCCKSTCSNRFNSFCIVLNIIFAYVFQFLWIILTSALVVPILIFNGLNKGCNTKGYSSKKVCQGLKNLGFNFRTSGGAKIPCANLNPNLCQEMPNSIDSAKMAFGGALLVSLSMGVFLTAMSANFTHLKYVPKKDRSSYDAM
ncbi:uncharacterized protein LOC141908645 [Tubulanus polymorphus]|uniref:uncharacterized protein LOC141908645 n=1 Tax=Tubulanus polymorphus TaxID=672921 RepID=UPI003DA657E7